MPANYPLETRENRDPAWAVAPSRRKPWGTACPSGDKCAFQRSRRNLRGFDRSIVVVRRIVDTARRLLVMRLMLRRESDEHGGPADIAFADTVHVRDLDLAATGDELPPVSGPVIVNDPDQGAQRMTPRTFPLPVPSQAGSRSTKLRVLPAIIGAAVFLFVAAIAGFAIARKGESPASRVTASSQLDKTDAIVRVRAPRTVDQHTGRAPYPSRTRRTRR
jgi:hypothetical protein